METDTSAPPAPTKASGPGSAGSNSAAGANQAKPSGTPGAPKQPTEATAALSEEDLWAEDPILSALVMQLATSMESIPGEMASTKATLQAQMNKILDHQDSRMISMASRQAAHDQRELRSFETCLLGLAEGPWANPDETSAIKKVLREQASSSKAKWVDVSTAIRPLLEKVRINKVRMQASEAAKEKFERDAAAAPPAPQRQQAPNTTTSNPTTVAQEAASASGKAQTAKQAASSSAQQKPDTPPAPIRDSVIRDQASSSSTNSLNTSEGLMSAFLQARRKRLSSVSHGAQSSLNRGAFQREQAAPRSTGFESNHTISAQASASSAGQKHARDEPMAAAAEEPTELDGFMDFLSQRRSNLTAMTKPHYKRQRLGLP